MTNIPRYDNADRTMEAWLDELGELDRSAPAAAFEERLMSSIRREVLEPLGQPIPMASRRWLRRDRAALALAASIMVGATAAMMFIARSPEQPQPLMAGSTVADEFDEYIETVAWLDESLPQFGTNDDVNSPSTDALLDDLLLNVQESLQGIGETG